VRKKELKNLVPGKKGIGVRQEKKEKEKVEKGELESKLNYLNNSYLLDTKIF